MPVLLLPILAAAGWAAYVGATTNAALTTPQQTIPPDQSGIDLMGLAKIGAVAGIGYLLARQLIKKI